MQRNEWFLGLASVLSSQWSLLASVHLWGLCQAEGTHGECFLLNQRLLEELAACVVTALQHPQCYLAAFLDS